MKTILIAIISIIHSQRNATQLDVPKKDYLLDMVNLFSKKFQKTDQSSLSTEHTYEELCFEFRFCCSYITKQQQFHQQNRLFPWSSFTCDLWVSINFSFMSQPWNQNFILHNLYTAWYLALCAILRQLPYETEGSVSNTVWHLISQCLTSNVKFRSEEAFLLFAFNFALFNYKTFSSRINNHHHSFANVVLIKFGIILGHWENFKTVDVSYS